MTSSPGKFLHTLLGYDSAPGLYQIILYWSYLLAALMAYVFVPMPGQVRPGKAAQAATVAAPSD
jgi:hypothetical protein